MGQDVSDTSTTEQISLDLLFDSVEHSLSLFVFSGYGC